MYKRLSTKQCRTCMEFKDPSQFSLGFNKKPRRQCKSCNVKSAQNWYSKNQERGRAAGRAFYHRNKHRISFKKYGLSREAYNAMYMKQLGLCALCHEPFGNSRVCIDHDHKTKTVRGLLHSFCNTMLGFSKESVERLQFAVEYLTQHSI